MSSLICRPQSEPKVDVVKDPSTDERVVATLSFKPDKVLRKLRMTDVLTRY